MYFKEPMPACVPEYYRNQQDGQDHRYGLLVQRQERYQVNLQKLDAAIASGFPVLDFGGYDSCWECPDADHDTMTADDDDFDCVICRNPACPQRRKEVSQ